jgi:hypothetical protein
MTMHDTPKAPSRGLRETFIRTPLGILVSLVVAALGLYLLVNHTGHVLGALPYLFLLACPLMHVFMHGGHHHERQ